MYYQLLNGCPAVVVPVKVGSPLVAWDALTLEEFWKISLPKEGESLEGCKFDGIVKVLSEYLDLCVDWARVSLSKDPEEGVLEPSSSEVTSDDLEKKKLAVKEALTLLVAGAVRSGESKDVKDKVDKGRSGIAMWRIP